MNCNAIAYITLAAKSDASPRNDTANISELPNGDLVAVWHKYNLSEENASDFGKADIAMKISKDHGRSWTDERIIVRADPADLNIQAPALTILPNGELLLGALRVHGKDSSTFSLFRSGDAGESWTPAGTLWSRSKGQWLQGGATGFVRTSTNRLLLPFHGGEGTQGEQHNRVGLWATDDGSYWRRVPASIDLPMRGAMEASVAEVETGRLLMALRSQLGTVFLSESLDDGESWSLPWSSGLTAPESCTCLRRATKSGLLVLFWNGCGYYDPGHHHFGERTPLSIALSNDGGRCWRLFGNLEEDENFEYTNVNCTFAANGDAFVTYCAISPAWERGDGLRCFDLRLAIIPAALFED